LIRVILIEFYRVLSANEINLQAIFFEFIHSRPPSDVISHELSSGY
jgi:hypothetical protein